MSQREFEALAEEALSAFAEIADGALQKLATEVPVSAHSFAAGNTWTGGQAYQNIDDISQSNREAWTALRQEPSIARLLLEDEDGQRRVVYM